MLDTETINKIIEVIQRKHKINLSQIEKYPQVEYYKPYVKSECYFDELAWEIEEVKKENKFNNAVHLEDELWDMLWDYMNLLYFLGQEWKIDTVNVTKRCYKKYLERIEALENNISWDTTKKKQKDDLKQEHIKKYEQ